MNKERRNKVDVIRSKLDQIKERIGEVLSEEQEAFDNLPESLQDSDRGEAMQNAIDALESAESICDDLEDYLCQACDS